MCGFCGIVHRREDRNVDMQILFRMKSVLTHRGSEEEKIVPGKGVAIVRCGSAGDFYSKQRPRTWGNEDSKIYAILDGEIYNRTDLRKYLIEKGHHLGNSCDDEILPHLYEEAGDRFVEYLNGIFAIALYDMRRHRLILVRDRLGVKPLYFAALNETLAFASDFQVFIQHPQVDRTIDLMAFSEYLTLAHTIPPRTILKGVQKLSPGSLVIYEKGELSQFQYWDLRFPDETSKDPNIERHVEKFREAFKTAVQRPLLRNAPIGAFLSGGMDSSSIVAMLHHLGLEEIFTYSAGYQTFGSEGELSRARIVANKFGTRHREIGFSAQDYLDAVPRFISYMDEPVADEASPLRMLLAEKAKNEVTIIIGGEAGDDVTAGYTLYTDIHQFERIRRFQRIPRSLRYTLPRLLKPILPDGFSNWLSRGNRDISSIPSAEHKGMEWAFDLNEKRSYCPILTEESDHCHDVVRDIYARSGTTDPLSQILYFLTKTWVAEKLMMGAGKMTMSYGLEFRPVFLDHELVELSAQIPSRFKIYRNRDGSYTSKGILRKAMNDLLPNEIMTLPKSPFTVPLRTWLHDALLPLYNEILLSDKARTTGFYDMRQLRELLKKHTQSETPRSTKQIRNLLFFEMWRQRVLS